MAEHDELPFAPAPDPARREMAGVLERFTFRNPENGFAVVRFRPEEGAPIVAVGTLAQLVEGQRVRMTGLLREHPRFGTQLEVETVSADLPSSAEGIAAYLGAGLVKGIGPATAEKIVARFGADTLRVIEEEPRRLAEVRGLGQRKIQELRTAVQAQKGIQEVMVFLRAHGLGPGLATRVVRRLGGAAAALIQANPYRLAEDVIGIGFKTADRIAAQLGIEPEAPERLRAGLLHALAEAAREGHCFLPEPELVQATAELLAVAQERVAAELPAMLAERRAVAEPPPLPRVLQEGLPRSVYPLALHVAEAGAAQALDRLVRERPRPLPLRAAQAIAWWQQKTDLGMPEGQVLALQRALDHAVSVVTGGPGVGKTTIVRALVEILAAKNLPVLLAAPTGRAAKRLEEATGHGATTLHRLLEYAPHLGRFTRDETQPLEGALLVVDETSMLDIALAYQLLRAVPPGMRLVLVGDPDQLPAVGPGNFLRDVIASGRVPVTHLSQVFRQKVGSSIVEAAHGILRGEVPRGGGEGGDFFVVHCMSSAQIRATVRELVVNRIPRRFGLDPRRDVQVLCPMYRGEAGADTLNHDLQDLLNPGQAEVQRGTRTYRVGDKVMQIRNDYDLDVCNGDLGRITALDKARGALTVHFGDHEVGYTLADLDQLLPAYAISVHRSQGSEYPAVVVPVANEHFLMLRRNLLYTAITRGKRLVVLVGSPKAIATAVRNDQEQQRWSALAERLKDYLRGDGVHPEDHVAPRG